MKLRTIIAEELDKPLKASIHSNGRLGFSSEAAEKMELNENQSIRFSVDEDSPNEKVLYAELLTEVIAGAFKVYKAGNYFYLSTKNLFDNLKYDYSDGSFTFEINKEVINDSIYYKFKQRSKVIRKFSMATKE